MIGLGIAAEAKDEQAVSGHPERPAVEPDLGPRWHLAAYQAALDGLACESQFLSCRRGRRQQHSKSERQGTYQAGSPAASRSWSRRSS